MVFNHAIRHEWMDRNPITKVRTSAKRLREPDVLSPAEIASLLAELNLREHAMVMPAGSTGLRRSELVALTWADIDLELMQVNVRRLLCAESLRRHQDRSEPQVRSASSFRGEVARHIAEGIGIHGRERFSLSVDPAQGKATLVPKYFAQEDHPPRTQ